MLVHLNKSGNDTLPLRKRSDFKQALSTLERLHQEAGGQQLRPMPYWKYQQRHVIEFFLQLVSMERILVVFLRIQRKSRNKRQAKACDRSGQPVVYSILAKISDEWLSRIPSILVQKYRLQLTAVYCNRRVCVRTTLQRTRFSNVNNYKELQETHKQVKSQHMGRLTTTELMTRMR